MKLLKEGKAKFYASTGDVSAGMDVFYNPVMKLNRDISVWLIKKLKPKRICCAMAASGVRALRFALEAGAKNIVANDANKKAVKAMERSIKLNKLKITVKNMPVRKLLAKEKFDYIDIDPFGPPTPFIEAAVNALKKGGIIALTATDTSCLCGRYVKACERKYSARPLKCGFEKEIGLRILISKAQSIAASQNKTLVPIFSHSTNHYMRTYLIHSKRKINKGYLLYCPKCLNRKTSKTKKGRCCNRQMLYAGPLWLGRLWDKGLIGSGLIPYITEESKIKKVGFYDTHMLAKIYKKDAVRVDTFVEKLKKKGFLASRTHIKPEGVKTDAEIKDVTSFL